MEFYAGRFNPLVQATKNKQIYNKYQETKLAKVNGKLVTEGEDACQNPSVMVTKGPLDATGNNSIATPLGKLPEDAKTYGSMPAPEFQSGMILVDPDLKLLAAVQHERNLLAQAGLQFDPNDDIRVIKDNNGKLKGAIAVSYEHMGQIIKINYMDVDKESENFKKSIVALASQPGSSLTFFESLEIPIIRNEIRQDLIEN